MNLLNDPWIPVNRRGSEKRELIRPFEITDSIDTGPYHVLDATRPDFNGSILQFLIGIVQTVMTPVDEVAWVDLFRNPPSKEALFEAMQNEAKYFDLEGEQIRFMQEVDLQEENLTPIASLLIDSPGANTIYNNIDHFVKRNSVDGMCEACVAAALFTLNTNAPSGGAGIRTSLRGGGPLTVVVIPDGYDERFDTLWHMVWLNILIKKDLEKTNCSVSLRAPADRYPWAGSIRVSKQKGTETTAKLMHPFQTYWGMPRRIKLDRTGCKLGICDVCGAAKSKLYREYEAKPYGINYGEGILHPLSPYYSDKDGLKLPVHPQPGGFTYRHWPLYIASNNRANPRPITLQILDRRLRDLERVRIECDVRILVFGYDMNNMKARCWYETKMPYWLVPEEIRDELVEHANLLAEAAFAVARNTSRAVKEAWFNPNDKVRGDFSYLENEFWSSTESDYYDNLRVLQASLNSEDMTYQDIYENWMRRMNRVSLAIFDQYAEQVSLDAGKGKGGIPRQIKARNDLIMNNLGKKVRETILGLPPKSSDKKKEGV